MEPCAPRHPAHTATRREIVGRVPRRAGVDRRGPGGPSSTVSAWNSYSNEFGAALRCQYPLAILPRRVVPHVLRVSAFQIRHPVPLIVLVKADDRPQRRAGLILTARHVIPISCPPSGGPPRSPASGGPTKTAARATRSRSARRTSAESPAAAT